MNALKITKNKILIIVLIALAVGGYYVFRSPAPDPLTTTTTGESGTIGQKLVVEINRLRALQNIQGQIFEDAAFASLRDFTQTVVAQPIGRGNPFAPVGN